MRAFGFVHVRVVCHDHALSCGKISEANEMNVTRTHTHTQIFKSIDRARADRMPSINIKINTKWTEIAGNGAFVRRL